MSRTNNSINWKTVREELVKTRNVLFQRFGTNPADTRLAARINLLDDQILECEDHLDQANKPNKKDAAAHRASPS